MPFPEKFIVIYLDNRALLPSAVVQTTLCGLGAERLVQKHDAIQENDPRQAMQLACIPMIQPTDLLRFTTNDSLFPASTEAHLYTHGCTGRIVRVEQREHGDVFDVFIEGLARFEVLATERDNEFQMARIKYVTNRSAHFEGAARAMDAFVGLARRFVVTLEKLGMPESLVDELKAALERLPVSVAADLLVSLIDTSLDEKLAMLSTPNVSDRITLATQCVTRQIQVLQLGRLHNTHLDGSFSRRQREFYLRQQLDRGRKELDGKQTDSDNNNEEDDLAVLNRRIVDARLPDDVLKVVEYELKRLDKLQSISPEWGVLKSYLEVVADLPWHNRSKDVLDISIAKRQLDGDHFGLLQAKKRIIEYLAVVKIKGDLKTPILCLVGPPGVGKTSLGKSIAVALSRKLHRVSLGGVKDEADMRGHPRTYIGAMPGLIIQGIRRCGVSNPVMLLDEVDKLTHSAHGDPAAALLEILDPEQNNAFHDHYLNFAYDLSKILFIATANTLDTIPGPLVDRMEIIRLHGYTFEEKSHIARLHLLPKQLACHGLASRHLEISDDGLACMTELYTRESGVRALERTLASVIRSKCVELAQMRENNVEHQYVSQLTRKSIVEILGVPPFDKQVTEREPMPGIVTSLTSSSSGNGGILIVESTKMPGKGHLTLTGSLGDVLKESARIALTWVKIHAYDLKISQSKEENIIAHHDIHIHIPHGAVPKDGPSAGVAMVCSLVSLLSEGAVMPTTAMTGEISLRGMVLPDDGIKEKVISAHRAGIRKIILPEHNRKDVEVDIPASVKMDIQFLYAKTIWDVVKYAVVMPVKASQPLESHL